MYEISWETLICVVLLHIVVCGCIYLLLVVSYIGFIKEKAHGLWHISKGGSGIYHYHYSFEIYE